MSIATEITLNEFLEHAAILYVTALSPGGRAPHLESAPGRGKTTTIKRIPAVLSRVLGGNYGCTFINGACATLTKINGFLNLDTKNNLTHFSKPSWWFTDEGKPLEAYDGGIVFIDEEDKMFAEEKKTVADGKITRVIGDHKLPPGWVIFSAGNRRKDRSGSTKELDYAIDRTAKFIVKDCPESLISWMEDNCALPETISFTKEKSEIVFSEPPEVQGPWATPRGVMSCDIYMRVRQQAEGKIVVDKMLRAYFDGTIGPGAAAEFITHIQLGQELPDIEDLVAAPKTIPVPERMDVKLMAAYKYAAFANSQNVAALVTYYSRLGEDFAPVALKTMLKKEQKLLLHPAVSKWCSTNGPLMSILQSMKGMA